ncbi:hypothetical protein ACVIJ6_002196 [Bradyrhizobium sp. USDA 4369]
MNVTPNGPHRVMIRPDIDKQLAFGLQAAHQRGSTVALAILAPDAEQQGPVTVAVSRLMAQRIGHNDLSSAFSNEGQQRSSATLACAQRADRAESSGCTSTGRWKSEEGMNLSQDLRP